MKVINLWAGPGSGKSTTAAGLFHFMKLAGRKVELVTEYVKDVVYEGGSCSNQLMILAQQDHRLRRLIGQVDYAITDSPLMVGLAYAKPPFDTKWFAEASAQVFHTYDNVNFFIRRVKPYATYGRTQTANEAAALDDTIRSTMRLHGLGWIEIDGDADAPYKIAHGL